MQSGRPKNLTLYNLVNAVGIKLLAGLLRTMLWILRYAQNDMQNLM